MMCQIHLNLLKEFEIKYRDDNKTIFNVEYNIKPFIARGYIRGNKCLLRHNIPEYKMNSIMKHKIMPSLINYKVDDISFEVI